MKLKHTSLPSSTCKLLVNAILIKDIDTNPVPHLASFWGKNPTNDVDDK